MKHTRTIVEFNGVTMPYKQWLDYDRTAAGAGQAVAAPAHEPGAKPERPVEIQRRKRRAE